MHLYPRLLLRVYFFFNGIYNEIRSLLKRVLDILEGYKWVRRKYKDLIGERERDGELFEEEKLGN